MKLFENLKQYEITTAGNKMHYCLPRNPKYIYEKKKQEVAVRTGNSFAYQGDCVAKELMLVVKVLLHHRNQMRRWVEVTTGIAATLAALSNVIHTHSDLVVECIRGDSIGRMSVATFGRRPGAETTLKLTTHLQHRGGTLRL